MWWVMKTYVETRIHQELSLENSVKHVTGIVVVRERVMQDWETSLGRWEGKVLLEVLGVATLVCTVVDLLEESVVQEIQILPRSAELALFPHMLINERRLTSSQRRVQ